MENYINPTAEGQADPFSEWNRQEGEDDLPNSVTALAPDGSKPITGPISRQHQKAIVKVRRKEAAYFRNNPGSQGFTRAYVPFEDGGVMFRETGEKPALVKVFRCGDIIARMYLTADQLD
jgi:hypothetical protein